MGVSCCVSSCSGWGSSSGSETFEGLTIPDGPGSGTSDTGTLTGPGMAESPDEDAARAGGAGAGGGGPPSKLIMPLAPAVLVTTLETGAWCHSRKEAERRLGGQLNDRVCPPHGAGGRR